MNCDSAIDKVGKVVGMCIMVRDYDSFVVAASSQRIQATYSPQVAQAMAIFRGLMLAQEIGFWQVEAVVVGWVNDAKSKVGLIVENIKLLSKSLRFCSFSFVSRNFNYVAHCLAKQAMSIDEDLF